jgi:diguanylate cyclase (GGDEF)-like protein
MASVTARLAGSAFAWRLTAAFVATLIVIGSAQYLVGSRQFTQRMHEQTLAGYSGDARVLTRIHTEGGWGAVAELLGHISHRPSVIAAGIVGPDDVVVLTGSDAQFGGHAEMQQGEALHDGDAADTDAATHADDAMADEAPPADVPAHEGAEAPHFVTGSHVRGADRSLVHEARSTGHAQYRIHREHAAAVAIYAVPVEAFGEDHTLVVETEMHALAEQLTSLRTTLLAGLVMAVLLGIPLFYLIGGRRFSALMRHHQRRAVRDALTDLSNHRAFQETIREEVDRARATGSPLTLALIDLDGFKLINDTMGHRRGDELLAQVGAILAAGRAGDQPFRVGGDEFALLLPDTDVQGARVVAERLRSRITEQIPEVGASVGMAELGVDADDVEALLACADAAMYRAKRRGRSLVVAFADLDPAEADAALTKGTALRALIEDGDMHVAFQPVVDLDDDSVIGYEALARLPQVAGFSGPAEAFETAERLGLVPELDAICRRAVLGRAGDLPDSASLFLNVAPAALDHDLLDWEQLGRDVVAAGLTPSRVVIELTERSRVAASVLRREVVAARAAGFRIAVDDVGAGWTGFEALRATEPDVIKIDRAIVANAATDDSCRATLIAVLVYAEVIGAQVIGEGVEDVAMLELLRNPDIAQVTSARVWGVQGYLFGKPATVPTAPCRSAVSL